MENANNIGVRIATCRDKYGNTYFGLEDEQGREICPKDYTYIHPAEYGLFLVEKGVRKNLLRPDGTLVMSDWYHDIYSLWEDGCFIFGNTIRKTKTTPTQYLRGVAHVSGIILFPMKYRMVSRMKEHLTDEEKEAGKEAKPTYNFYGEIDGAPYMLLSNGGLYDPKRSHLPTKLSIKGEDFIEKVVNWVLPGLQFYYRDTDAPVIVKDTYHVGDVLRAGFYVDATTKLLKPVHKTRFIIASAHGARLAEQEDIFENAKKWGLTVFHYDNYFKVMDVYKLGDVTQVLLLHIPPAAAFFMGDGEMLLNFVNEAAGETSIVDMARQSLEVKMKQDVSPRSKDAEFVERMAHPIGLDDEYWPVPFNRVGEPDDEKAAAFSAFIHHLSEDDDIKDFIQEEDNFEFTGAEGSVCEDCIYKRGIVGNGEGCGRLFKASFRDRWLRGRCEYKKTDLFKPSVVEYRKQKEIETQKKQSDEFALKIVREFIAEELDGDVNKLATFNFEKVKNGEKYGSNLPYGSLHRAPIMQSLMVLLFSDVWPELNVDAMEHYKYLCGPITEPQRLFGANIMGEYLMAFKNRGSSHELMMKAMKTDGLTYNIGNWWVLPGNATCFNTKYNYKFRGYGDQYLKFLYDKMTSTRKCKVGRKTMPLCECELLKGHAGEEGYVRLIHELMIEDYADAQGHPIEVFDDVWSFKKGLTEPEYEHAVERYCKFMDEVVPKRASRLIEKLKTILEL